MVAYAAATSHRRYLTLFGWGVKSSLPKIISYGNN